VLSKLLMTARLLLIDNDGPWAGLLSTYFWLQDYEVHCAHNLCEVDALLNSTSYRVIIVGASQSRARSEGVELLKRLAEVHPHPTIFLLRGSDADECGLEPGPNDFVLRSVAILRLGEMVSSFLDRLQTNDLLAATRWVEFDLSVDRSDVAVALQ
jgi:DNA-binding response OmpR family regulator